MFLSISMILSLVPSTVWALPVVDPDFWYGFDDCAGGTTSADTLGAAPDLTLEGASCSTGNALGSALGGTWDSDGALDNVLYTYAYADDDAIFEPTVFTISSWVYLTDPSTCSSYCTVVSKGNSNAFPNGYSININTSGDVRFVIGDGTTSTAVTAGTVSSATWHHLVSTWDGTNATLYLDGVMVGTDAFPHGLSHAGEPFFVGHYYSRSYDLIGSIDEVAMWDSVLSDSEIAALHAWYADTDGDGINGDEDCDPDSASVGSGLDELCDGIDNDCDDTIDEDSAVDAQTWYTDADEDGFGDPATATTACTQPSGTTTDGQDCDDTAAAIHPDADEICDGADNDCDGDSDEDSAIDADTWYPDSDGDGWGDSNFFYPACDQPSGTLSIGGDCSDTDASISPDAEEVCDNVDNNCDGIVDEDSATDASTWYLDSDGDGFGDSTQAVTACTAPSGYIADDTDCDDLLASTNPAASETCDGVDNNCDGDTDEDTAIDISTWYIDYDGDGYGSASFTLAACDMPTGYVGTSTDCDDTNASVFPGAAEVCDGQDNDCDGDSDEADAADASTWYVDADGDGYGDATDSSEACDQPSGSVADGTDCDDASADISPAGTEVCDGQDNDCDGDSDESDATDASTWYADADADGYGDASDAQQACEQPSGTVADSSDCDDTDGDISPAAEETWYDGVDGDCAEDDDYDADADGHASADGDGEDCDDADATVYPEADEVWYDGIDSDCAEDSDYDADADGFDSESYDGDDCDDADPLTYPGAEDEPYDGVIQDCDHTSDYDADSDGYDAEDHGGADCDDASSAVSPDADEIWYDGIDQDCDGNDDDQDADGWAQSDDCDDTDPESYPGAEGLDEDCQPVLADTGAASDAEPDSDAGKDGCGCAASSAHGLGWSGIVGLLALSWTRRREHQPGKNSGVPRR